MLHKENGNSAENYFSKIIKSISLITDFTVKLCQNLLFRLKLKTVRISRRSTDYYSDKITMNDI